MLVRHESRLDLGVPPRGLKCVSQSRVVLFKHRPQRRVRRHLRGRERSDEVSREPGNQRQDKNHEARELHFFKVPQHQGSKPGWFHGAASMNGQRLRKHNREEVPPAGIEPRERRLGGEFFAASLRHFQAAGDPRRRAAFALQFGGKIRQSSAALRHEKIAEIGPPPSPTPRRFPAEKGCVQIRRMLGQNARWQRCVIRQK